MFGCLYTNIISCNIGKTATAANMTAATVDCNNPKTPVIIMIIIIIIKVNFTPGQTTKAQTGSRGIAVLFLSRGLDGGGWSTPLPGRFTPGSEAVPIV